MFTAAVRGEGMADGRQEVLKVQRGHPMGTGEGLHRRHYNQDALKS